MTDIKDRGPSNVQMDFLIVANGLMVKEQDMVNKISNRSSYLIDIFSLCVFC